MKNSKPAVTDASAILDRMFSSHPGTAELAEEERVHAEVAAQIHSLRTGQGMTQAELARAVGTTQSVIACLENTDYQGHSLRMLRRVAAALGARVVVGLVATTGQPVPGPRQRGGSVV
jgi:predicted XRE-type DNA-binding protein